MTNSDPPVSTPSRGVPLVAKRAVIGLAVVALAGVIGVALYHDLSDQGVVRTDDDFNNGRDPLAGGVLINGRAPLPDGAVFADDGGILFEDGALAEEALPPPPPDPCEVEVPAPYADADPVSEVTNVANFFEVEACSWATGAGEQLTVEVWPLVVNDTGVWFNFDEKVDAEIRVVPDARRVIVAPHVFPATLGPPIAADNAWTVIALTESYEIRVVAIGSPTVDPLIDLAVQLGTPA